MDLLASPVILFAGLVLGAVGVALAMPRRGLSPQVIGALVAAAGLGAALLSLGVRAGEDGPGIYFYVFAFISLGASLRVITHPRPVYAALYFILTILSSAGLYLLLSSEFLAFALVIIYAGAILITYLFVIMLATQAPTADEIEALSSYDRYAREPIVSTIAGFLLLAALTGLIARGVSDPPERRPADEAAMLAAMPRKNEAVVDALREAYLLPADARIVATAVDAPEVEVLFPSGWGGSERMMIIRALEPGETMVFALPEGVEPARLENIERVGMTLVGRHPLGLELAGVILLMAMLGAIVLSRKQVQIEEALKRQAAGGLVAWGRRPMDGEASS